MTLEMQEDRGLNEAKDMRDQSNDKEQKTSETRPETGQAGPKGDRRESEQNDTGENMQEKEEIKDDEDAGCPLNETREDSGGFRVFRKRKTYVVTEEKIKHRIEGENMSSNVFRDLLGVNSLYTHTFFQIVKWRCFYLFCWL